MSTARASQSAGNGFETHYVRLNMSNWKISDQSCPVLSVDGGGLRGILPAVLLVSLETAIKQYIVDNAAELVKRNLLEAFRITIDQSGTMSSAPVAPDIAFLKKKSPREGDANYVHVFFQFEVYLADFVDVFAGTSTGSIIATYLSSRGVLGIPYVRTLSASKPLWKALRDANIAQFQTDGANPDNLWPGSALVLVATFWAEAYSIFPSPNVLGIVPDTTDAAPKDGYARNIKELFETRNKANLTEIFATGLEAKYTPDGLQRVLKAAFTDGKLSNIKSNLLVTTLDLSYRRPLSFVRQYVEGPDPTKPALDTYGFTAPRISDDSDDPEKDITTNMKPKAQGIGPKGGYQYRPSTVNALGTDFSLWEIVRSSTAAPTYFPAAEVKSLGPAPHQYRFCDGGVAANDPVLQAIVLANRVAKAKFKTPLGASALGRVAVLSLGTGGARASVDVPTNAGLLGWMLPSTGVIMDGNAAAIQLATEQLANEGFFQDKPRYVRINYCGFVSPANTDPKLIADLQALQHMDVCNDMPRLTRIAVDLLSRENEHSFSGDQGVLNRDLLADFAQQFLLPQLDAPAS